MRFIKMGLGASLAVLLAAFGCGSQSSSSTAAGTPTFNASRSWADLQTQCNFGTRNPASTGKAACLAWLKSTFALYTTDVEDQSFSFHGDDGVTYAGDNIIATFASASGTTTTPLLIAAHWDSRPVANMDPTPANRTQPIMGADDGASGVAVLTELARELKAQPPPQPVVLVALDLEDLGETPATTSQPYEGFSLGSRYFAANMGRHQPGQGIVLDMIGYSSLVITQEAYSLAANPALMAQVYNAAGKLGYAQQFNAQPGEYIIDDHKPLIDAGVPTIDLIDLSFPWWHTLGDTADKCSSQSLGAVGQTMLQVIYAAASVR